MADVLDDKKLLVKYGFIKLKKMSDYEFDKDKGYYVKKDGSDIDPEDADVEKEEEGHIKWTKEYQETGYPKPFNRFRLIHEEAGLSMEEMYYWCLNHIKQDFGFPFLDKITDLFTASEQSASFGNTGQRMSIQQDRASGFLRGISELVKTLFEIVRELRIIDERLDIYNSWEEHKSADATLKGLYADFAENKGGQMQPGSIYHLADTVGYAALPDLFFNTVVYKKEDIDKVIDSMESFNPNVRSVLKRKLYQFIVWKEKTHKELESRRQFQIRYLRQHYLTIKMYMSWVKPYLKHIKRLTMNEEDIDSENIVSAFDTSTSEVEILAYRPANKGYHPVVLMNFKFLTKPVMQYRQDFNQGPVHIGKGTMTLRCYGWTTHQIKMYKAMKDYEDRELLGLVDDKLQDAMAHLGDDLDNYLKEAEGIKEKEESKKEEKVSSQEGVLDPFKALFDGFGDIFDSLKPGQFIPKKKKEFKYDIKDARGAAGKAHLPMWMVYNNYKKAHRLLSW